VHCFTASTGVDGHRNTAVVQVMYRSTEVVQDNRGPGEVQGYRGSGVKHGYTGKGVVPVVIHSYYQ